MAAHFHHVSGRFRVHLPRVKGSTAHARFIEKQIGVLPGVIHVEAREVTGSVIVQYDPGAVDAGVVWQCLCDTGASMERPAAAVASQLQTRVVEAVLWCLVETAVQRSLPLVLGALL